jgi:hypothetical protein
VKKHTINDGVRMVGQLLLHRPTTRFYARDSQGHPVSYGSEEASCFCYLGAMAVVSETLGLEGSDLAIRMHQICGLRYGGEWDNIGTQARKSVAVKMCRVTEP